MSLLEQLVENFMLADVRLTFFIANLHVLLWILASGFIKKITNRFAYPGLGNRYCKNELFISPEEKRTGRFYFCSDEWNKKSEWDKFDEEQLMESHLN